MAFYYPNSSSVTGNGQLLNFSRTYNPKTTTPGYYDGTTSGTARYTTAAIGVDRSGTVSISFAPKAVSNSAVLYVFADHASQGDATDMNTYVDLGGGTVVSGTYQFSVPLSGLLGKDLANLKLTWNTGITWAPDGFGGYNEVTQDLFDVYDIYVYDPAPPPGWVATPAFGSTVDAGTPITLTPTFTGATSSQINKTRYNPSANTTTLVSGLVSGSNYTAYAPGPASTSNSPATTYTLSLNGGAITADGVFYYNSVVAPAPSGLTTIGVGQVATYTKGTSSGLYSPTYDMTASGGTLTNIDSNTWSFSAATPGTYTLTGTWTQATDYGDEVYSNYITVSVVDAPLASLTASSMAISLGNSTVLTPIFSGGTGVIDGIGTVISGNTYTVSPTTNTTYTLTVTNIMSYVATSSVTVDVYDLPVITSFTAAPINLLTGMSTVLTPTFSNGTAIISPTVGTVTSGTEYTATPSYTTTYVLTVTNPANDSVSAYITISVNSMVLLSITGSDNKPLACTPITTYELDGVTLKSTYTDMQHTFKRENPVYTDINGDVVLYGEGVIYGKWIDNGNVSSNGIPFGANILTDIQIAFGTNGSTHTLVPGLVTLMGEDMLSLYPTLAKVTYSDTFYWWTTSTPDGTGDPNRWILNRVNQIKFTESSDPTFNGGGYGNFSTGVFDWDSFTTPAGTHRFVGGFYSSDSIIATLYDTSNNIIGIVVNEYHEQSY